MIPGIIAGALLASAAPAPILVTEDPYRVVTVFQLDATGEANGTGKTASDDWFGATLNYVGSAAIASEKFEFNGTTDYIWSDNYVIYAPLMRGTWEMFGVEFDDDTSDQVLWSLYHATGGHSWRLRYNSGQLHFDIDEGTGGTLDVVLSASFAPATDGTPYDIAYRWTGTEVAILVNGVVIGTAAYSAGFGQSSSRLRLGCDDGASGASPRNFFNGRIAAARLTAEYDRTGGSATTYQRHALPLATAAGTVGSAATDPTFANVKFLTSFEGTDGATTFTDDSGSPVTPTFAGNAQIDTAEKKFGSSSLLLDGSGDYVALGSKADFQGTNGNDIVFEGWAYLNTAGTGIFTLFSKRPTSGTATEYQAHVSNRRLTFTMWQSGSGVTGSLNHVPFPPFRWVYFVVKRISTDLAFNLDGLWLSTGTQTGTVSTSTNSLDIGRDRDFAGRDWNGWIDELRIVRGEDYLPADDYTPPTAAFPRS